jgi:hypothetical protein
LDSEDQFDVCNDNLPNCYNFKLERNFGYEIQEYFHLKKELRKKKVAIMNGDVPEEEGAKIKLLDPEQ